jgi:hypothetical protein
MRLPRLLSEVATREYLRHELEDLSILLADLVPENPGKQPAQAGHGVQRRVKKSGSGSYPPLRH